MEKAYKNNVLSETWKKKPEMSSEHVTHLYSERRKRTEYLEDRILTFKFLSPNQFITFKKMSKLPKCF